MPSECWGKEAPPHDGDAAAALVHVRDPSQLAAERGGRQSEADMSHKLLSLYSSRTYKSFLHKHQHRVPHFLAKVEVPKVQPAPPSQQQTPGPQVAQATTEG